MVSFIQGWLVTSVVTQVFGIVTGEFGPGGRLVCPWSFGDGCRWMDEYRWTHVLLAEYRPARSESPPPHTQRSSWPGPEPSSVEADVYVWCYALLVVHARKEEVGKCQDNLDVSGSTFGDVTGWVKVIRKTDSRSNVGSESVQEGWFDLVPFHREPMGGRVNRAV